MHKHEPRVQQKTERRISAALRLVLVAVLFAVQIVSVFLLSEVLRNGAAYVYTILNFAALVLAVIIYSRPGGGSYNFVWVLVLLTLPVAGALFYLLWGTRLKKRLTLKKLPRPLESVQYMAQAKDNAAALRTAFPQWGKLADTLLRKGFYLCTDTQTTYFPSGEEMLEDMISHMENARKCILMEYFILARGEILTRMMDVFRRKCAEGVEIKLLFDDFGSMMRFSGNEVTALRRMGVQVRVFNPVHQYVNRLYFNYRDHRKILCIDGDIAYTGGVNIADEYANLVPRFGYWKDCGVRLEGEGAWGLTREFLHMWQRTGGELLHPWDAYRPNSGYEPDGWCQVFTDGPDNNPVSTAEDTFLQLIGAAEKSVWITTPYLAIDEAMMKALCLAGDAGLDVRLMLPGIPDHKLAYTMAQDYFGQLMDHAVHIYTYSPGLLHGKAVLIDDTAALIGSINMDYRSFVLHFECAAVLYGTRAAHALHSDMETIAAQSHEVTVEEWSRRPLFRKLTAKVLRLFATWM